MCASIALRSTFHFSEPAKMLRAGAFPGATEVLISVVSTLPQLVALAEWLLLAYASVNAVRSKLADGCARSLPRCMIIS